MIVRDIFLYTENFIATCVGQMGRIVRWAQHATTVAIKPLIGQAKLLRLVEGNHAGEAARFAALELLVSHVARGHHGFRANSVLNDCMFSVGKIVI